MHVSAQLMSWLLNGYWLLPNPKSRATQRRHDDDTGSLYKSISHTKVSFSSSTLFTYTPKHMFDQLKNLIRNGRRASQSSSTERKVQQQQLGPDRLEAVERLIKERKATNNEKTNNGSPHEHIQQRYQLSDKLGE